MIPVMAVLLIPTLLAMPLLYPWMHAAGDVIPSVSRLYLNVPAFVARSVVAFVGWSLLAIALPRTPGPHGTLLAAVGLVFYGVLISLIPIDWILSLEHPFISESFGASVAFTQLIAALAWAAVLAPAESQGVEGDLGGLLLATVLGITYIDYMAVLVIWYGDLPDKVFWFVERDQRLWSLIAVAAFVLVSLVPIASLLLTRVRTNRQALRVIGLVELVGLAVYNAYLIVPPFGWLALVAAALTVIAIGPLFKVFILTGRPAVATNPQRSVDVHRDPLDPGSARPGCWQPARRRDRSRPDGDDAGRHCRDGGDLCRRPAETHVAFPGIASSAAGPYRRKIAAQTARGRAAQPCVRLSLGERTEDARWHPDRTRDADTGRTRREGL